ncbi:hypothetical protein SteCoe_23961 [Stentor coeruleus]|uniref:NADPH--hemoprotein reductase n=1 Tax=Stentor coeruleus TaxID=5963 RepID=A0A1R2BIP8_9CILI|nr:hypothetical protein SteCoe_23961 [Stentor coeruleus]
MSWTLALIASILLGVLSWLLFKKSKVNSNSKRIFFKICIDSQKGHIMNLATILAEELQKYNFVTDILPIEHLQINSFLEENYCVILCSTHTNGSLSEATSHFIKDLEKFQNKSEGSFNLLFTVFNIEKASNSKGNIKRFVQLLENLGAIELVKSTSGDEKDFALFQMWMYELLKTMSIKDKIPKSKTVKNDKYLEVALQIPLRKPNPKIQYKNPIKWYQESTNMEIIKIKKLNQNPDTSILNVEIITINPYETAGKLGIFPENPSDLVQKISELQNYDLNQTFQFISSEKTFHPFPTPTTVHKVLSVFSDLTSFLNKKTIAKLSHFAQNSEEKQKLLNYFSIQNPDDTFKKHDFSNVTIIELFHMFPSIHIPIGIFVQIIPRIKPRFYFISSYNKYSPRKIQIVVQMKKKRVEEGKIRRKMCLEYIENMFLNGVYKNVKGFCLPSKFKIPKDSCLIHMICNHCGIAAFKGLLLEIQEQTMLKNKNCQVVLYLISKSKNRQFLYKQYIEMLIAPCYEKISEFQYLPGNYSDGPHIIKTMFLGFSKDHGNKNIIKDILYRQKGLLWESLKDNVFRFFKRT